jgi:hypothetical protein
MGAPDVSLLHEAEGYPMRNGSSRTAGRSFAAARALQAQTDADLMFNLMINAGIVAAAISICSLLIYLAP